MRLRRIPVVLLSAHSRKEEIILGLQAGADDYLTKPIHPPEVLARIEAHLRLRGYYAELEHRDLTGIEIRSLLVVPIIRKATVIGTFLLRTTSSIEVEPSDRISNLSHQVATIAANAFENAMLFESMKSAQEFFEEMAIRDGLTRLYSHRYFYHRFDEAFSRARRYGSPFR